MPKRGKKKGKGHAQEQALTLEEAASEKQEDISTKQGKDSAQQRAGTLEETASKEQEDISAKRGVGSYETSEEIVQQPVGVPYQAAPSGQLEIPEPKQSRGRGRGRGRGQVPAQQVIQQQTRKPYEAAASSQQKFTQEEKRGPDKDQKKPDASHQVHPAFSSKTKIKDDKTPGEEPHEKPQIKRDGACSQKLLEQVSGLSLQPTERETQQKKYAMAKRPGYGTKGRNIQLIANYFVLQFKDKNIYHYDVDIVPVRGNTKGATSLFAKGRTLKEDKDKNVPIVEHQQKMNMGKAKCREIVAALVRSRALQNFCPVYDGQKNIFTSRELPFRDKTSVNVDVNFEGQLKTFCITIQPVKKPDGSNIISLEPLKELYSGRSKEIPQEVLLVFDTVMNHREPPLTQVHLRNSFFDLTQNSHQNLGYGLEIWFGYSQSVRLAQKSPVVVVNLAAKAFHKAGSVINYACDILNTDIRKLPRLNLYQVNELTKALKSVRVRVTHQRHPRTYKVKGVSELSAKEQMLDTEKRISVAQYFAGKYRCLTYPFLPCLHMQSNTNKTYIPMENCEVIEGQAKIGKLSGELTAQMIRNTAVPPAQRFQQIMDYSQTIQNRSRGPMDAFGLIMDVHLMRLNGRVIAAPALSYAGDAPSRIAKPDQRGVWKIESGKEFYQAVKPKKWILMSFANERFCGHDKLRRYCEFLVSSSRKCGMRLEPPFEIKIFDQRSSTEEAIAYAKRIGAEFSVIVLSRKDNKHSYEEVKFLADFKYGLVTQCMEDKSIGKINDQITTNVCLKINVKLGGINHVFLQKPQIFSRPIIVFGADAIHWARGYGYPSIASVVGSLDPTASRYALTCRLQNNEKEGKLSQEIIRKPLMQNIVKEILEAFSRRYNGKIHPEKILFFRDGVSEGQFTSALEQEVSAIQEACSDLYKEVLPVTYVVVQKRHQTRLRPQDPRDGAGRMGNVPPGTTVDTNITHPVFFDFFLCSHEGIQGTSKPAHYTVLHDDNRFTADDLQQLCHFLCHSYIRCTRSVSIPAPVLYADLAAARAKKYADLFIDPDSASSSSSDSTQKLLPPKVREAIESMQSFENNMFYV
ncbi:Protein argonaute-4, partial [Stegodyphus mimosarum]